MAFCMFTRPGKKSQGTSEMGLARNEGNVTQRKMISVGSFAGLHPEKMGTNRNSWFSCVLIQQKLFDQH